MVIWVGLVVATGVIIFVFTPNTKTVLDLFSLTVFFEIFFGQFVDRMMWWLALASFVTVAGGFFAFKLLRQGRQRKSDANSNPVTHPLSSINDWGVHYCDCEKEDSPMLTYEDKLMSSWCRSHIEQLREKYKHLIGVKIDNAGMMRIDDIYFGVNIFIYASERYPPEYVNPICRGAILVVRRGAFDCTSWRMTVGRRDASLGTWDARSQYVHCRIDGHTSIVSAEHLLSIFENCFVHIPKTLLQIVSEYIGLRIITVPNIISLTAWFGNGNGKYDGILPYWGNRENDEDDLKRFLLSFDKQEVHKVTFRLNS